MTNNELILMNMQSYKEGMLNIINCLDDMFKNVIIDFDMAIEEKKREMESGQ